jgi:hypothetical protein
MVVTALEAFAIVAQEKGAGHHHVVPVRGAVLKRAADDHADRHPGMRLLERAITWPRRANDIQNRPPDPMREMTRRLVRGGPGLYATRNSTVQIGRNFSQDSSALAP